MAQYESLRGERLEVKVVYASSAEELHSATNLEMLPLEGEAAQTWSNLGWVSDKYCTFPQTLVFQLEASALLKELRIVSHEAFIGKRIELFVGVANEFRACDFRRMGHIYFSSNKQTGFTARETKLIRLDTTANFVKLQITECHNTVRNLYEQVSLISVEIYGIKNVPHVSEFNIDFSPAVKSKNFKASEDPTSSFILPKLGDWGALKASNSIATDTTVNEVDEVLLSLGLGFDLVAASRPAATMEHVTQRVLDVVESEKKRAVSREDFKLAQKLQEQVNKLREIGTTLITEEEQKYYAIARDDYEAASKANLNISRMKTMRREIAEVNKYRLEALKGPAKKSPMKKKPMPPPKKLAPIGTPSPKQRVLRGGNNRTNSRSTDGERKIRPAVTADGVHGETYAALQIQKIRRGKIARKEFDRKKKVALFITAKLIGDRVRRNLSSRQKQVIQEAKERRIMAEDEKKAAIKIQALHRGKKSRQDMDLNKKKMLDDAAEQRRMKEQEIAAKEAIQSAKEKEVEEQEEVKAATKIQASFRGTQARNELKTQDELVDRNERPVGRAFRGTKKVDPFGQEIEGEKSPLPTPSQTPRKRANPNDPLQSALEDWVSENLPDRNPIYPQLLEGFERHAADDIIKSFGETVAACAWSKNWKFRGAAAATVAGAVQELHGDISNRYIASCYLCQKLLTDTNPSVASRTILLLRKVTENSFMKKIPKDQLYAGLDHVFPSLFSRTGDSQKALRRNAQNAIVALGKNFLGPHYVCRKLIECEAMTAKSVRTICGVNTTMLKVCEEFGFTKASGMTYKSVMTVASKYMRHPNIDVRTVAMNLVVFAYSKAGAKVEKHLIGINTSTLDILGAKLKDSANEKAKAGGKGAPQLSSWVWTDAKLIDYIKKETGPKDARPLPKIQRHEGKDKKKMKQVRKPRK